MRPLPVPVRGGSIADRREFLKLVTDADWILLQTWLLGCFRPAGPYPMLALHGEQGIAKSTTSHILGKRDQLVYSPLDRRPRTWGR